MMEKNHADPDTPLVYDIGGMHCAACSSRVERVLGQLPGVAKASVNLATAKAKIWLGDEHPADMEKQIEDKVAKIGFTATPVEDDDTQLQYEQDRLKFAAERKERLRRLWLMIIFCIPLLLISMGHMAGMPLPAWLDPHIEPGHFIMAQFLLTAPVVWLGRHFYTDGIPALLRGAPNMDSLVAVGTGAAFLYSLINSVAGLAGIDPVGNAMNLYYESCAVLLTMIELGKFMEFTAKQKAGDAMGALMTLTPDQATILSDTDTPQEVPLQAVKTGDRVLVKPGARVPVDGIVVQGESAMDLSLLTGESMPVPVGPDSKLTAGSLNGEGSLIMRVTAVGRNTKLAHIIKLVRDAQGSKAPIARLADRISYYFVPAVMVFALLAALAWLIFSSSPISLPLTIFVAVLVMACPCAMGLATPMSIMVGTGRGAQLGVLIKNGAALEQAGQITTLCLDKTGTLTTGTPALMNIQKTDMDPYKELSNNDLLAIAASLEGRSEHPLALAIVKAAASQHCQSCVVDNVKIRPGLGIAGSVTLNGKIWVTAIGNEAFMTEMSIAISPEDKNTLDNLANEGSTPLLMALGSDIANLRMAAILPLSDQLRQESPEVAAHLRQMGIKIFMLTGDNQRTAQAIAHKAGIENVRAQLLPDQKADFIRELQAQGELVGMVGDGLNDAPALAVANVGLAVGTGVDVSADAGDIVLMRGGMHSVLTALALSRATMRNIRENLGWAFGYNIVGLPIAAGLLYAFGGPLLSPMIAGAAMALSSVSVVTNALRLRNFDK